MTQRSPATAPTTTPATPVRARPARTPLRAPREERRRARRPNLERQSISFTVGLYLFICAALLTAHFTAGGA
ncbi:hypothetical protein SAMN05518682_1661 [Cellulosimicrobium aquatile]|uniref:Uncharacterized protein n=2 Tax=Cellulosimicrobium TaxID=157920 RepID=A0AAV5P7I9_CELCE|nr:MULTISPECIES: hypothetical protein [Cellulosimicrobium]QDP76731.1 hypothetical protein FOG94_18000 [Cellulosimicrobium cellulans]GLY57702.1 hypothetical protein Ccel01_23040 [Cellulosimicrobium cellulans]SIQ17834.1 hypothetical protein SAMN05518682_1661 [Cellulosimicrobium aquatile]